MVISHAVVVERGETRRFEVLQSGDKGLSANLSRPGRLCFQACGVKERAMGDGWSRALEEAQGWDGD